MFAFQYFLSNESNVAIREELNGQLLQVYVLDLCRVAAGTGWNDRVLAVVMGKDLFGNTFDVLIVVVRDAVAEILGICESGGSTQNARSFCE